MKDKRIAIIIMLFAGTVISFSCLLFKIKLVPTLLIVSATLFAFYFIGVIITKVIEKINAEVESEAEELTAVEKVNDSKRSVHGNQRLSDDTDVESSDDPGDLLTATDEGETITEEVNE